MRPEGQLLRAAVIVIVAGGLMFPIVAGLWETARAAFGVVPALQLTTPSLAPWRQLMQLPGFATSVGVSIMTGVGSTLLSLALAIGFSAVILPRMTVQASARLLSPFLAIPHAALAIGLAFLLAPSGWIARLIAPFVGWDRPPDIATVNDGLGLALTAGLVVKETPFLLLMILSALSRLPARELMMAGRSLGYAPEVVWLKVIVPQLWPLIRLPTYVVLAFALSTVDMAIILGPSNPPTLAVAIARWFSDPDVGLLLPASAGALVQAVLVATAVIFIRSLEAIFATAGRHWVRRGARRSIIATGMQAASAAVVIMMLAGGAAMVSLVLWSITWRWPFPQLLPDAFSLNTWSAPTATWGIPLSSTVFIAVASTLVSLALAIAWLEGEDRARRGRAGWTEAIIYLPLLVPQIAFLYGVNILFLRWGLSGGFPTVIWVHAVFVFPYVMVALSDPWRSLDPRLASTAASLGAGPNRRLLAVKLPILVRPLMTAASVGVAVSVAQYLPTLFIGSGRISTLTTEAVTLSSGSDRRVVGVYATLQAVLPLVSYAIAIVVPAIMHRDRIGMQGRVDP